MHLDRKSDPGHKKCTAHGSRDATAKAKGSIRIFISMLVSFLVICQDFLVDLAKCTKAKFK